VGTAFLLCHEAKTPALHRRALEHSPGTTALTRLFTGRPARGLLNRLMRDLGPMAAVAPAFPLAGGALAPLRSHAEALGLDDFSPLWSGTQAQACRAVSAADVVQALMAAADGVNAEPSSAWQVRHASGASG